ncbi:Nramp family divalent metal transporter [Sungkyunkwania multivorans]|uniref:Nramp family divalent metal transporter n=1 Tax=Sungkyunkwania multivorans TaxID=1173618 RepID=A0ABW3CV81_9FLAO
MKNVFKDIGPATLVTAAFIGPGTVTVCTLAGATYGFDLLWAMLLSTIATLVLQEMSARVGIVTQKGLSDIIRTSIGSPILKAMVIILTLSAIAIGNAAYEAGNISGGILGLETLFGEQRISALLIGAAAFVLLYFGNYKILERIFIVLVTLMSLSFIVTAYITKPDVSTILKGLLTPKLPKGSLLTVIGLIGTTVVPYNLFLHASLVKEKWNAPEYLANARRDTLIAIILGGVVSMAIIITAASIFGSKITNATDMARGLEPLYGRLAKYFLAVGLFAAGITSAITAPLATAYVVKGCLGWKGGLKSWEFRAVWMTILFLGVLFSSFGIKSIEIIQFAQVTNGLLLPLVAGLLLWTMNKKDLLGSYRNTIWHNLIGLLIVAVTIFLGGRTILSVFGLI